MGDRPVPHGPLVACEDRAVPRLRLIEVDEGTGELNAEYDAGVASEPDWPGEPDEGS